MAAQLSQPPALSFSLLQARRTMAHPRPPSRGLELRTGSADGRMYGLAFFLSYLLSFFFSPPFSASFYLSLFLLLSLPLSLSLPFSKTCQVSVGSSSGLDCNVIVMDFGGQNVSGMYFVVHMEQWFQFLTQDRRVWWQGELRQFQSEVVLTLRLHLLTVLTLICT